MVISLHIDNICKKFLQDAWKRKGEKNLKIIWYEDMRANLSSVLTELADFTGFEIPNEKMEVRK